jgi:HB1/ASXL restriction endonuclease-like protein with HTH domain
MKKQLAPVRGTPSGGQTGEPTVSHQGQGFTDREVALLDAWDTGNRPQIDDAFEARVLEAVHEAEDEHELDPLLAAEAEEAVVIAMVEDAAEACLELRASENDDHRSSKLGGAVLRQEQEPSGGDAPEVRKQRTSVGVLGVVEEILRETCVPMSVREIVERAGTRLPTRSKAPDTVVARDLAMDLKRRGDQSLFVRTSPGRYTLRTLTAAPSAVALPQRRENRPVVAADLPPALPDSARRW